MRERSSVRAEPVLHRMCRATSVGAFASAGELIALMRTIKAPAPTGLHQPNWLIPGAGKRAGTRVSDVRRAGYG